VENMSQLIEKLLKNNSEADLDAIAIYKAASQAVGSDFGSADKIADHLAKIFVEELGQYNLANAAIYAEIEKKIFNWQPDPKHIGERGGMKEQNIGFVQGILLSVLAEQRLVQQEKQANEIKPELKKHAEDYKLYLEMEIKKESEKMKGVGNVDHNYYFNPAHKSSPGDLRGLQGFVANYAEKNGLNSQENASNKKLDNLGKLIKKYQVVNEAIEQLDNPNLSSKKQVENFSGCIERNYKNLAERRDNGFTKFMKGVMNVISLGATAILGTWKAKGEKVADKMMSMAADLSYESSPKNK
jgi:hypothetical protein